MDRHFTSVLACCAAISFLLLRCRQTYDPKVEASNKGLLVVDGFINSGPGPTTIRLSRTGNLKDRSIIPETGAQVTIEKENGSSYILTGDSNGYYSIAQLQLDNGTQYRLDIKTTGGKEYVSDYVAVKYTPPIDSITWQGENDGLQLYASAHDLQNGTRYYEWKYEETWEFHSAYYSSLKYIWDTVTNKIINIVYKHADASADTTIYKCWNTVNSSTIILGSTEKLTADMVYLPVRYIEPHSEKLSVLYSINLRQYAVSHDNYLFLQKMKKNTEQLGSLFDAQPSQLSGNIHCLTNPNETVIGFIEITQEQTKRIFINNNQVPAWNYNPGCAQIVILNDLDSIAKYGYDLVPTLPQKANFYGIISFYASIPRCVDCTIGHTNKRPDFWP